MLLDTMYKIVSYPNKNQIKLKLDDKYQNIFDNCYQINNTFIETLFDENGNLIKDTIDLIGFFKFFNEI